MGDLRVVLTRVLVLAVLGCAASTATAGQPAGEREEALSADGVAAVLGDYCVSCHNEGVVGGTGAAPSPLVAQLRATGLALDTLDVSAVPADAAAWEAVVRN